MSLFTIGADVFGGALSEFHVSVMRSGPPTSIRVGMLGRLCSRLSVATSRILALPPQSYLQPKSKAPNPGDLTSRSGARKPSTHVKRRIGDLFLIFSEHPPGGWIHQVDLLACRTAHGLKDSPFVRRFLGDKGVDVTLRLRAAILDCWHPGTRSSP